MRHLYSASTGLFYIQGLHTPLPADAKLIPDELFTEVVSNRPAGKVVVADANGLPMLVDQVISEQGLCAKIDAAADAARRAVAGDPLRAVEYANAATEAQFFANADYLGDVPPMVAAWAINGRTPQQAADDILREAAQYNAALVQLRVVRLNAKELIRTAMAAGQVEQAQDIADETIASIEAAVAGIGNNAGV